MVPTYQNGFEIVEIEGKFHCMKNGQPILKWNKQPEICETLDKAEFRMSCNGAKKVLKKVEEDEDDDLMFDFEMEVDKRRMGKTSEYLDSLDAKIAARERETGKPVATFVLNEQHEVGEIVQSGSLQYRVSEKPNYVSEKEAAGLEDLDPGINSGWYTKVELVS